MKYRIILDIEEYDDLVLKVLEGLELTKESIHTKYSNHPLIHYFIADNKEALIATSTAQTSLDRNPYLWTDDSNLIRLLHTNFERIWRAHACTCDIPERTEVLLEK